MKTPRIEIYTSMMCGYCHRAKHFFETRGFKVEEIDVSLDPALREEMVRRTGGRRSVPQILIDDFSVGGFSDLLALERAGKLDPLLGKK